MSTPFQHNPNRGEPSRAIVLMASALLIACIAGLGLVGVAKPFTSMMLERAVLGAMLAGIALTLRFLWRERHFSGSVHAANLSGSVDAGVSRTS